MGKVIMSGLVGEMTVPVKPLMLGDVAEGQIITIKENNNPVEFYVAKHNYEEGLNGKGRTLVVRKEAKDAIEWNKELVNAYASSYIDNFLNTNYKKLFSKNIQNLISTTKFIYTIGNSNWATATLDRSIFLLSLSEFDHQDAYANQEGTAISINRELRQAKKDGRSVKQWTRTPRTWNPYDAFYLREDGVTQNDNVTRLSTYYTRPIFTLPATTRLNPDRSVIE